MTLTAHLSEFLGYEYVITTKHKMSVSNVMLKNTQYQFKRGLVSTPLNHHCLYPERSRRAANAKRPQLFILRFGYIRRVRHPLYSEYVLTRQSFWGRNSLVWSSRLAHHVTYSSIFARFLVQQSASIC